MKPAPFDYIRPDSMSDVHAALASEGADARILAGGQSLVPMLSMRLTRFEWSMLTVARPIL